MNSPANALIKRFLSTRETAEHLGIALSTVQAWVESGALPAWKTSGGHRRIPCEAVEALKLKQQTAFSASTPELFKVLVVEDDPTQRELYRHKFAAWDLPIQVIMAEDGFIGLLAIGRESPDLIITDLAMPEIDGFSMIRRLKSHSAGIHGTIIVVTALSPLEIEAQGGLPLGIPVYQKPIPFTVLRQLIIRRSSDRLSQELVAA